MENEMIKNHRNNSNYSSSGKDNRVPNKNIIGITKEEMEEIGNYIHYVRKDIMDISQARMSLHTGLSERTIIDLEKGRKCPNYDTIVIISTYLGIDPGLFFPSRLSSEAKKGDQELIDLMNGIQCLDENHQITIKSFLKTYITGAKMELKGNKK